MPKKSLRQIWISTKKIINDPTWRSLGGIFGVVVGVAVWIQNDSSRSDISIIHNKQVKMVDQWLPSDRFKLLVEGSSLNINEAVIDYYFIFNESKLPVRPSDFVSPVQLETGSATTRIVSVESCAKQNAQECTAIPGNESTGGSYVATTWKKVGNNWIADSPLLNSGDIACVLVVSEHSTLKKSGKAILPAWSARIAGYNVRVFESAEQYQNSREKRVTDYLLTSVNIRGAGIYYFLLLQVVILFASLYLAGKSNWISVSSNRGLLNCVLLTLTSMSTSEILVDVFVTHRGNFFAQELSVLIWPLLVVHVALILYLAIRAIRARKPEMTLVDH